jgi:(E)-4-hydroxy-3-methylbut-2-enyl-diphosphate synthase
VPVRIGVNGGSLEPGETLVSSALKHVKLLEDEGFRDIAVSVKASDVPSTLAAYRELAERTDCPLHLGLTEAGTRLRGTVHSSVALGILLAEGLGDTIRVSLTADPALEVKTGIEILRASGLRAPGPSVTSCPTCGRTRCDVQGVAERVESALEHLHAQLGSSSPFPRVAVMGCVVNGPGEARNADIALCGGNGEFFFYEGGERRRRLPEGEAVGAVVEAVRGWISRRAAGEAD